MITLTKRKIFNGIKQLKKGKIIKIKGTRNLRLFKREAKQKGLSRLNIWPITNGYKIKGRI